MKWLVMFIGIMPLFLAVQGQENQPFFETVPCPFTDQPQFECGYLIVPENHAAPDGPTIRLMVAIHHTAHPNPAPDPVIFLSGGPGGRAVGSMGTSLIEQAILANRDLIYLDQRGVGFSDPNLDCVELNGLVFSPADPIHNTLKALRACRDRLTAQGIQLENYTTRQNAADIAALREVLGYESWNLWGSSYGTRLALTVMRHHPEGIRSVILDSAFPPGVNRFIEGHAASNAALDNLFEACAEDLLCDFMYPDLDQTFRRLVEMLNERPVLLSLRDPRSGAWVEYPLDGTGMAEGAAMLAASPLSAAYLPSLISDFSHQDYHQVSQIVQQLGGMILLNGLSYSVLCSEELPFALESGQADENMIALCQDWFLTSPDPVDNVPVRSEIPTLILAGQMDGITPPNWGSEAAELLSKGYFYELPGLGHGVMGDPCSVDLAAAFLDHPDGPPDATCIDRMPGLHFVIPPNATRPYARASAALFGIISCFSVIGLLRNAHAYRDPLAMKESRKLINLLPLLLSAGLIFTVIPLSSYAHKDTLRLVEIIISLTVAVQTVFAFSPDNDLMMEVLLSCPRRIYWVLLERFGIILLPQAVIATFGSLIAIHVTGETEVALTLVRWIPTMMMLTGIGSYVSLRSRSMVFGIAITLLFWFAAAFMGAALLPGHQVIKPLHYLQPFLWPFLPYAVPEDLNSTDYLLNRAVVLLCGINLLMLAVWQLRDEERLLFGTRTQKER